MTEYKLTDTLWFVAGLAEVLLQYRHDNLQV